MKEIPWQFRSDWNGERSNNWKKISGVNVFGGGLPLYNGEEKLIGAIGLSSDRSRADHNIAWKLRANLKLDKVPGGVSPEGSDNIVFDISDGKDPSNIKVDASPLLSGM